jgi:hypothetical protein
VRVPGPPRATSEIFQFTDFAAEINLVTREVNTLRNRVIRPVKGKTRFDLRGTIKRRDKL